MNEKLKILSLRVLPKTSAAFFLSFLLEELNKFKTSASDKTLPLILNFKRVIT